MAKRNPLLESVLEHLNQAYSLVGKRNRYVHNGIVRKTSQKFCFLKSGKEFEETEIVAELKEVCLFIEKLLQEIQRKIPIPPLS